LRTQSIGKKQHKTGKNKSRFPFHKSLREINITDFTKINKLRERIYPAPRLVIYQQKLGFKLRGAAPQKIPIIGLLPGFAGQKIA
jgi:hypothetical protein